MRRATTPAKGTQKPHILYQPSTFPRQTGQEEVVPQAGLEPACREATDFESVMYTNSITEAYHLLVSAFLLFSCGLSTFIGVKIRTKYFLRQLQLESVLFTK